MNIERILRLADTIERTAIPDLTFDMREFCVATDEDEGHVCGTTACIAGWAMVDSLIARGASAERAVQELANPSRDGSVSTQAARWLDLDMRTAADLFLPDGVDDMDDVTPAEAAGVLRHLAKTGEVVWPDRYRGDEA